MAWQPIETAPKVRGKLLLGFLPNFYPNKVRMLVIKWDGLWLDDRNFTIKPTHWMPLPEPPDA